MAFGALPRAAKSWSKAVLRSVSFLSLPAVIPMSPEGAALLTQPRRGVETSAARSDATLGHRRNKRRVLKGRSSDPNANLQAILHLAAPPRTVPSGLMRVLRRTLGCLWEWRPFRAQEHRSGARSACEHSVPFSQVGALPQRGFPSQADPSQSPVRATTPKRSPGYRRRAPARRQTLGHGALLIPSLEGWRSADPLRRSPRTGFPGREVGGIDRIALTPTSE